MSTICLLGVLKVRATRTHSYMKNIHTNMNVRTVITFLSPSLCVVVALTLSLPPISLSRKHTHTFSHYVSPPLSFFLSSSLFLTRSLMYDFQGDTSSPAEYTSNVSQSVSKPSPPVLVVTYTRHNVVSNHFYAVLFLRGVR